MDFAIKYWYQSCIGMILKMGQKILKMSKNQEKYWTFLEINMYLVSCIYHSLHYYKMLFLTWLRL